MANNNHNNLSNSSQSAEAEGGIKQAVDKETKRRNFLILNSGSPQKEFILKYIKQNLGEGIILVNQKLGFAKKYIDHFIEADTYNHQEVIEKISSFLSENPQIKISGAITFWEDDIPLLARVCQQFRFTGNNLEAAENTRNKYKMRRRFEKTGIPSPRYYLLKSKEDLEKAIEKIGFPAVIKPAWGASSEFVVKVNNKEEARETFQYILENATPKFNPIFKYNNSLFLYEEYVEGMEISLECFVQFGIPRVIGILEKRSMREPYFIECGDIFPARLDSKTYSQVVKAAESALIALGVKNSLAHVEMKLTKKGPMLMEVASRMGGDYIWDWVKAVYGVDLIDVGLKISAGDLIQMELKEPKKCLAAKYFIPEKSGIITKIWGANNIQTQEGLHGFYLSKTVGNPVFVPPEGFENIGWIVGEGYSYSEAEKNMQKAYDALEIEICPFKPYSSIGRRYKKDAFPSIQIIRKAVIDKAKIEKIRVISPYDIKNLHIGILCNKYETENNKKNAIEQDLMSVGKNIQKALEGKGYKVTFFDMNESPLPIQKIQESDADIIFNVCERINNSSLLEPNAASLLDILQIPYTGSSPFTLALCIDKIKAKKLLSYNDIPTPEWDYIYSLDEGIDEDLKYPLIVKPANTDNSIGITNESVVTDEKELLRQLEKVIIEYKRPALVEEYIDGDEYDVTIIGNGDNLKVLPLSRSIFDDLPEGYWHIYPFQAKWAKDGEETVYDKIRVERPAKVPKNLAELISEIAVDTYNILGCHDYGRVEIRTDQNSNPYVLELNPNPSINVNDSTVASAELIGLNYADFIEEIIKMAIKRYKEKPPYYHLQSLYI